jgi:hypothetical protein
VGLAGFFNLSFDILGLWPRILNTIIEVEGVRNLWQLGLVVIK